MLSFAKPVGTNNPSSLALLTICCSVLFLCTHNDRWLNVDGLEHNIVFSRVPDGVDKSALDHTDLFSDGSVSSTFDTPGTYMYFSTPHLYQGMVGRIIVT